MVVSSRQGIAPVGPWILDTWYLPLGVKQSLEWLGSSKLQEFPQLKLAFWPNLFYLNHAKGGCGDPHVCGLQAWLVGNKGLPEAVVASTQKKMLAALGYSASPSREPWLQEGED
ncbi:hypothetical protein DSO57_1027254 [Entomophthora muscae]|uniref:Uncharacterized protein n=1 Tax=Entomophthora muscae TaxID=34485 RepID=A0ACC2SEE0_9FUNG|nr:hypothetical protein DSO57_1027254 [Entomophthora muscae]